MRILYRISFCICLIQLLFFLVMPFGGLVLIRDRIKGGFYDGHVLMLLNTYVNDEELTLRLGQAAAIIYFASLTVGVVVPLLPKINIGIKHKITMGACIVALVFLFAGKLLVIMS